MNRVLLLLLIVFFANCKNDVTNDKKDNSCNCPLETQGGNRKSTDKSFKENNLNGEINIDVGAIVKKVVDAKSAINGGYKYDQMNVKEIYEEIIDSNPELSQKLNIYVNIACAYYAIICQDTTLGANDKSKKLLNVIDDYKSSVDNIIKSTSTTNKNRIIQQQSNSNSSITVPKSPTSQLFNSVSAKPVSSIEAVGKCVIDTSNENQNQAKLLAERCALVEAQARLIERLEGIKIISKIENKDYKNTHVETDGQLSGLIKGAEQIGETKFDQGIAVVKLILRINQ